MQIQAPRGSLWAANAFAFYSQLIVDVYQKLFPKVEPRIAEANRLRRTADQIRIHHPAVAKELYVAADRHEREGK